MQYTVKRFALQTSVFIMNIIHTNKTQIFNIKQQNELFRTAKNSGTRMRPEAGPIEFAYGRAHFYSKKKVDRFKIKYSALLFQFIFSHFIKVMHH